MAIKHFIVYVLLHFLVELGYFYFNSNYLLNVFGQIQQEKAIFKPFFPFAFLTFLIYFTCVWYFVMHEIVEKKANLQTSITKSVFLAIGIYGVYNLTNYVALKRYPMSLVVTDTLWGIVSISVISTIMHLMQ